MKSQVLHIVWCNISGETAGKIWNWSLLEVKGLTLSLLRVINVKFQPLQPRQKSYPTKYDEFGFSQLTQTKDDYTTNSGEPTYTFSAGWENVLFELSSERVKISYDGLHGRPCSRPNMFLTRRNECEDNISPLKSDTTLQSVIHSSTLVKLH